MKKKNNHQQETKSSSLLGSSSDSSPVDKIHQELKAKNKYVSKKIIKDIYNQGYQKAKEDFEKMIDKEYLEVINDMDSDCKFPYCSALKNIKQQLKELNAEEKK